MLTPIKSARKCHNFRQLFPSKEKKTFKKCVLVLVQFFFGHTVQPNIVLNSYPPSIAQLVCARTAEDAGTFKAAHLTHFFCAAHWLIGWLIWYHPQKLQPQHPIAVLYCQQRGYQYI